MAADETGSPPRVFISYSHKDEASLEQLLDHLAGHKALGLLTPWHDGKIGVGEGWYDEIERELNACAVAIILVSAGFTGSKFCTQKEVPVLLERRQREGIKVVPIFIKHCSLKRHAWLNAMQIRPSTEVAMQALTPAKRNEVYAGIVDEIDEFLYSDKAKAAVKIEPSAGDQPSAAQDADKFGKTGFQPKTDSKWPSLPENAIDLTRLPTSGFDVVGRDDELRMLDEAFDGDTLNVVSLRAWGGVGKSTLVNKWCEYLATDNFRGARRVFAWSFYSQGTNQRVTSADLFINKALDFFGDAAPSIGSPWVKGERLAALVGKEKALLILDGMEPLLDEHQGIKDPALARVVECLAGKNAGLCVITTREPVKELADFTETTLEVNLEQLLKEAGRALLRTNGLRVADDLLEQISEAFGNHALALNLLASYLTLTRYDVHMALNIPDLPDVTVEAGKHPRRVMAAFADHFGEGPELDLLHVMGLFDRPAHAGCIASFREEPAIPGLTEALSALDEMGWRDLLEKVRDLGLLAEASHHAPEDLEAHPLVREHFGAFLRDRREKAWQAGHARLYEYLKSVPTKYRPDTLAEMTPLLQAIQHCCRAGREMEGLDEVYMSRLVRVSPIYSSDNVGDYYFPNQLSAFGAALSALSCYTESGLNDISKNVTWQTEIWLLGEIGFNLRALGRLSKAVELNELCISKARQKGNWTNAARASANQSFVFLTLGRIKDAIFIGEKSVEWADMSKNDSMRTISRTTLAGAYLNQGLLDKALLTVSEGESIHASYLSQFPKLFGFRGFRYWEILLSCNEFLEVEARVNLAREWDKLRRPSPLSAALQHLAIGCAYKAMAKFSDASSELDAAVDGLRAAGDLSFLPRALLARAAFHCENDNPAAANIDLDEVMRIAKRCSMCLFECDVHLEYARLALAEGNPDASLSHFKSAQQLVTQCGYHRRNGELDELREKLDV